VRPPSSFVVAAQAVFLSTLFSLVTVPALFYLVS
jgi:hypothetical protein